MTRTHLPPGLTQLAQEDGLTAEQVTRLRQWALRTAQSDMDMPHGVDEWRNVWTYAKKYMEVSDGATTQLRAGL